MLCLKHQIIASECEEYFASTFSNAVFDDCSNLLGDVYSKDVEMTENVMSEEQYNELLKAYTKEALASMIKADIRKGSPTFGQHVTCLLIGRDEEGMKIPEQLEKRIKVSLQYCSLKAYESMK